MKSSGLCFVLWMFGVSVVFLGVSLTTPPSVPIEEWDKYYHHAIHLYMWRFGKFPISLEEVYKAGYLYIEPLNPLTQKPIRNTCDSPSPGDYCLRASPDGREMAEFTLWDTYGEKVKSSAEPEEIWGEKGKPMFEFLHALKGGYREEEIRLAGYGSFLSSSEWYRLYCQEGKRTPEDFILFLKEPYSQMRDPLEGKTPEELFKTNRLKIISEGDTIRIGFFDKEKKEIYNFSFLPADEKKPCRKSYKISQFKRKKDKTGKSPLP